MNGLSRAHTWRGYIGLSLVWLVVLGIALFVSRQPASQPIEILPPPTLQPTLTPLPSPTPGPLRVDVAGAVHTPGVYTLPAASIIADAIAAAGGPSDDADLDRVNKAVPLSDGMQVYVPHVADATAPQPVAPVPAKAAAAPLAETSGGRSQRSRRARGPQHGHAGRAGHPAGRRPSHRAADRRRPPIRFDRGPHARKGDRAGDLRQAERAHNGQVKRIISLKEL